MADNRRILVFSLAYYPMVGGAEVALREIIKRNQQLDFTLLTAKMRSDFQSEETQGNVKIIRVGRGNKLDKYLFAFRAASLAHKLHRQEKFDLVWAMMANYAGLGALLFRLRHKIPYLLTLQSGDSDLFMLARTWFWMPFYRLIYKKADHIQAISNSLERRARKHGYRGTVSIVPNGVDLPLFVNNFTAEQVAEQKKELGIQDDEVVIITTSRLALKNAIGDLIKAINNLNFKFGITSRLLILGDGPERNKLEQLAQTQGIADKVDFLGFVDQQEFPKYFAVSDIFCRPSLSEGLGNSFLEAMAFGLPIIGTPVGGIVDFLKDGETGLFCRPGKPYTIAQGVEKYDKDRELYSRVSQQARELAHNRYDWDKIGQAMGEIFNQLLAGQIHDKI